MLYSKLGYCMIGVIGARLYAGGAAGVEIFGTNNYAYIYLLRFLIYIVFLRPNVQIHKAFLPADPPANCRPRLCSCVCRAESTSYAKAVWYVSNSNTYFSKPITCPYLSLRSKRRLEAGYYYAPPYTRGSKRRLEAAIAQEAGYYYAPRR